MAEWQWKRWDAVARLGAGKLTLQEAARVLRLSVRQVRRIRRAVERAGRAGLRHGNAGQVPVNKLRAAVRHRILRLRRTKYRDFNDAHFTEKLGEERPPLRVSVRTVRRVLRTGGVPACRRSVLAEIDADPRLLDRRASGSRGCRPSGNGASGSQTWRSTRSTYFTRAEYPTAGAHGCAEYPLDQASP